MKKLRQCMALTIAFLLLTACGNRSQNEQENTDAQTQQTQQEDSLVQSVSLEQAWNDYLDNVDIEYSYELAKRMEDIRSNENLGYRTAGSEAEYLTGEMLKDEMQSIGLLDVTKDEFTLDTWTFKTAQLTYTSADGESKTIELGGYQTEFVTDGQQSFTIIDGGQGTEDDLAGLDVEGKLVLVDINQRENWWINYPAYEAHINGAAAVIAAQDGGYAEVSSDALNAQDICGPADAPAFSISRTDADELRELMRQSGTNELTVSLNAYSHVEFDGTSYNIVGSIPGKDPDSIVLMSAHYDSYFAGFQDDNAAIALMLGIAKAIVESGYQPEKTLVFCAMAAEEWGVSNTRYDWSTGAYNQIFMVHPEWVGKVVADINFELPAMNEGDTDQIRTSYELAAFVEEFKTNVPSVEGVFPDGIEVIVPTQTWSDDFSLSIAGVPSSVTALRGEFAQTHYHSQYDNSDTYSPEAFLFHHNMYGMLMLAYDRCAVSPLNFTTRLEALKNVSDGECFTQQQISQLNDAVDLALSAAQSAWEKVSSINGEYIAALNSGDVEEAARLLESSKQLNADVLEAFKYAEDNFVRLTWEDVSIFPHEHSANNINAINGAISALESGDASAALDEYLYLVDNNWYAYDWSRQTYDYMTDYVLNQPAEKLMWGAGRVQGHTDLFDVINSLQLKQQGDDLTSEIEALKQALEAEQQMLDNQVQHELEALNGLTEKLNSL